ncbi:MAG: MCE family protein [Cyclobacteriaceae bacterium]|nr:MCE family protein [Cyclobacteriaceae bacterium]
MKNRNLKLGIFFTGSLLVLIVALFIIGARQNLFESNIVLKTYFKNALGLQEGSTVRYVGITIGSVEDVSIVDDTSVFVSLKISEKHAQYIFKNATAEISSDGLMGNKLVNIVPGKKVAKPVEDGDEIASQEPVGIEKVMTSLLNNSKNLEHITENLTKITNRINAGEGLVGRLLFDKNTSEGFDE